MSSSRSGRSLGKATLSMLLLSALAACGGGGSGGSNGGGSNTAPPPPSTTSRLTLTGTVTDAPIPNALVAATIGGQTFTATADANGNYRLELSVEQSATGGFITLTARGVGSQSHVEFISLAGTFQALKALAGSDEVLSSSESFVTQITNVSTAQAVLLQQANGGQPVDSQALIETLSPTLSGQAMLDLAAAIKLLVDEAEDYPMPSGHTSLRTLLSDTAAREQLVTNLFLQDPAAFKNAQNAIASDATLIRPIASTTPPATLTAVVLGDDTRAYYDTNRAISYTFNSNGTGTASSGTWHRNTTWRVSGGSVEIEYEQPLSISGWEHAVCPQAGFDHQPADYTVAYTTLGATLTLLGNQTLAITETRDIEARDCGPVPSDSEVVTVARTVVDEDDFRSMDIAQLRGSTRTLWIYNAFFDGAPSAGSFMPDLAELRADGTGVTRAFGKSFSWSLDAGGRIVNVTFDDGVTAKYRWLRELDTVATEILYEFTLPSGRRVDAGASLRSDPQQQLAFTAENVLGRHYNFGVDDPPFVPGMKGGRLRFDPGGLGTRESERVDQDGNVTVWDRDSEDSARYGFHWYIEGAELILQYTSNDMGQSNCDLNTSPCMLTDDARVVPLARVGTRTYWFESWRTGLPYINQGFIPSTVMRYYDHEPFGANQP